MVISLDHIALRLSDKNIASNFFVDLLSYNIADTFDIDFDDNTTAECDVLKLDNNPEIFISHGNSNSIVDTWVSNHKSTSSVHHIAFRLSSLEILKDTITKWKNKGINFASDDILYCEEEDLYQIFSKPINIIGDIIIELIVRGPNNPGFCKSNVKNLMESTKDNT